MGGIVNIYGYVRGAPPGSENWDNFHAGNPVVTYHHVDYVFFGIKAARASPGTAPIWKVIVNQTTPDRVWFEYFALIGQ